MEKNLMRLGVGAMLCIVVIGGLMVPFISEFNDNIVDKNNNPSGSYMLVNDSKNTDVTLKIENNSIYVNEYDVGVNYRIMILDSGMLTLNAGLASPNVGLFDTQNNIYTSFSNNDVLEFTDGSLTYEHNGTQYTLNYDTILYPVKNGNYSSYTNSVKVNVSNGDEAYLISTSTSPLPKFIMSYVNGVKSNLVEPFVVDSTNNTLTDYTGTLTFNVQTTESDDGKSWIYDNRSVTTESDGAVNVVFIAPNTYNTDGTMSMVKILLDLTPLFIGIGVFIAFGIYITRMKS